MLKENAKTNYTQNLPQKIYCGNKTKRKKNEEKNTQYDIVYK